MYLLFFIDEQTTKFYVPEALRKSGVCDVCGTECDFCNTNAKPWVSIFEKKTAHINTVYFV